jgi:hypothetical protein
VQGHALNNHCRNGSRAFDDTANVFRIVADAEPVNPAVDYARAS